MCIIIIDHIYPLVKSRHKSTFSVLEVYCIPKIINSRLINLKLYIYVFQRPDSCMVYRATRWWYKQNLCWLCPIWKSTNIKYECIQNSSVFEAKTLFVEVNVRVVKMLMCRGLTFTFLFNDQGYKAIGNLSLTQRHCFIRKNISHTSYLLGIQDSK